MGTAATTCGTVLQELEEMAELCKLDGNTQFKQRNWEASAVSPTSFGHQAHNAAHSIMAQYVRSLEPLAGLPQHT